MVECVWAWRAQSTERYCTARIAPGERFWPRASRYPGPPSPWGANGPATACRGSGRFAVAAPLGFAEFLQNVADFAQVVAADGLGAERWGVRPVALGGVFGLVIRRLGARGDKPSLLLN